MNAYELADILYQSDFLAMDFAEDAATMLRQQADQLDKVIPQLVKANGLIENLRVRIAELERTLSIMEGEYPEPTSFAKITEFNSLEEAYNRIVELEAKQKEILMEVKTSWTAISPVKGMPRESAQQLYRLIKEITE